MCRVVVKQYTWKTYDEKQTMTQLRTFALGMAITSGMHAWQGYTTPLVLAWLQPLFILLDPMFQSRVLGVQREVVRPVKDPLVEYVPLLSKAIIAQDMRYMQ